MGAGRDGRGPIPTLRPFEKGDLTRNMLVSPWRYTVSTLADIVSCSIIREESTNFDFVRSTIGTDTPYSVDVSQIKIIRHC